MINESAANLGPAYCINKYFEIKMARNTRFYRGSWIFRVCPLTFAVVDKQEFKIICVKILVDNQCFMKRKIFIFLVLHKGKTKLQFQPVEMGNRLPD